MALWAYVVRPDPGLVFDSTDQIAAEATALAVLEDAKRSLPFLPRFSQRIVLFQNPYVQRFDQTTVPHHPYICHGTTIRLGEIPGELVFENVPDTVQKRLSGLLR